MLQHSQNPSKLSLLDIRRNRGKEEIHRALLRSNPRYCANRLSKLKSHLLLLTVWKQNVISPLTCTLGTAWGKLSSLRPLSRSTISENWSEDHQDNWKDNAHYVQGRQGMLALFSLEKRNPKCNVIVGFNYLIRGYEEKSAKLFSEIHRKRRWNDHKIQQGKYCVNMRNKLPQKALMSSFWKIKVDCIHSWATCSNDSPTMKAGFNKMTSKALSG